LFSFGNINIDEAYEKKASVVVEFNDVIANKKHRLTIPLEEKGIHIPAFNIP
jgi:hypothetical protein